MINVLRSEKVLDRSKEDELRTDAAAEGRGTV